jgi:hypothetical protein
MGDKSPKSTHKQTAQKEAKKASQQKAKGSSNGTKQQAPPPKQ